MVDFRRHLQSKSTERRVHPVEIYDTLDRASDKGPLRPAQISVLNDWYASYRDDKDVILKLHTGQGKTLIGQLILQSTLNAGAGPALYLCPNRFLVEQTCTQAQQFGFRFCTIDDSLPEDFIDGRSMLITHVQMLFNGLTKFSVGRRSTQVTTLVLDDAHACLDSIRQSFTISIDQGSQPYADLVGLFADALADQGAGTFADIRQKKSQAFLPVPYWEWQDKAVEVVSILAKHGGLPAIKFVWPILRDKLKDCLCLVSGSKIEISPYMPSLNTFGSFASAKQRIFMSATINDDSFFIKGLGVSPRAISNPLRFKGEKWSGEKMVLIPSLVDETLDRETMVNRVGMKVPGRKYGVVALTPSFELAKLWQHVGATVAKKDTINDLVAGLKRGNYETVVAFANRYDGIDLPDNSCRILVLDSKPFAEDLVDRYYEQCRANSDLVRVKLAQTIEQGLGRHIRGEKDYGVAILIGPQLVKEVRSAPSRRFFSTQTRQQIEIGLDIVSLAKEETTTGKQPLEVVSELILQCINRDELWKDYYKEKMDAMPAEVKEVKILDILVAEKEAEDRYSSGDIAGAVARLQRLIDDSRPDGEEHGWFLQEMARFTYSRSKVDANKMQIAAHRKNPYLLKPADGMVIERLSAKAQKRVQAILQWVRQFATYEDLALKVEEILDALKFGVVADRFEEAIDELGSALGFAAQRPDRQWKAGPDNLWCLREGEYLLIECKGEVSAQRKEIHKEETGQMNNASGWFAQNYPGCTVHRLMIIPAKECGQGAAFTHPVKIMRNGKLGALRSNVRKFFREFSGLDLKDVPEERVEESLSTHHLNVEDMFQRYSEAARMHVN